LKELLVKFCAEDNQVHNIIQIRRRIENSGHAQMIKRFFKQFFLPTDHKKNTVMLEGVSNSGKT